MKHIEKMVKHKLKIMADRTSAEIFGNIFEILAKNPSEEHKAMALEIWPLSTAYDFNNYQMEADEALLKLDLAKYAEEDGHKVIIYRNYRGDYD
jgi:hypothetical protein